MPSLTSSPTTAPRLITPRDPSTPTDGAAGAFVAHLHGRPWLTHQRLAADVIGEQLPDGRYRYPLVVVLWPRQCGKTTWVIDLAIGRCLMHTDYRVAYAAQTGHVTTERFGDRFAELVDGPLATRVRLRRSAGTERVTLPGRSYVKAFPPKPGALRSSAMDLVVVDEAQEHGAALGEQLDLTILPTFTTRRRRQLIVIGTAGTDASDYLRRYLACARDRLPGYAVVEYGARAGDDLDDRETWARRHPGVPALTDVDTLATFRAAMGPAGFAREFLNVWSRTAARTIDPADWSAVQLPTDTPPAGPVCLGFDVAADRGSAAVGAGTPAGRVELVDTRPGTDWCAARLIELADRHHTRIAVSRFGAAGPVVDQLETTRPDLLIIMRSGDVANAAALFATKVADRSLRVYPSRALSDSVEGAAPARVGDSGGFTWARRTSAAPVAPLVAVSNALWGAQHLPPPEPRPMVYAE